MAVISLLLSYAARKLGTLVQAVFGWSVTALFGRLTSKKQIAVSVALVLSLAWPVLVVGMFLPVAIGWVLAFLPLGSWVSPTTLRIVWAIFAVVVPPIVGLIVRWAARVPKGSLFRSAVGGFPLALGFFLSLLITAITVPLVRLVSITRGWSDTHVYVQPREGAYRRVLREVAEAAARAGLLATVEPAPLSMTLATKVLRAFARSAVSPIVPDEVLTLRGEGLVAILYPSDLLLRGKAETVARVRAKLAWTDIDADAWLVGSPGGQRVQDDIIRILEVVRAREGAPLGRILDGRLAEIWEDLEKTDLPYEDHVLLEAMLRRLERRIVGARTGEPMPLDRVVDELDRVAAKANAREPGSAELATSEGAPEDASTAALVREVLGEAKELARLEIEIAKSELALELRRTKRAAIGFGASIAAAVLFVCVLVLALVLALGGTAQVALLLAAAFTAVGAIGGIVGYSVLPKKLLGRTRERLLADVRMVKEHIA